jgi:hypothetical protein
MTTTIISLDQLNKLRLNSFVSTVPRIWKSMLNLSVFRGRSEYRTYPHSSIEMLTTNGMDLQNRDEVVFYLLAGGVYPYRKLY